MQTVTRISQLTLGRPVVLMHGRGVRTPLCLVVGNVYDDPSLAAWTARTCTLRIRPGGWSAEVRQDNLVSDHQVPWHLVPDTDVVRYYRWCDVRLADCGWCPQGMASTPAEHLTAEGDPVCQRHGTLVRAADRAPEWHADPVAKVYAALGLA